MGDKFRRGRSGTERFLKKHKGFRKGSGPHRKGGFREGDRDRRQYGSDAGY